MEKKIFLVPLIFPPPNTDDNESIVYLMRHHKAIYLRNKEKYY